MSALSSNARPKTGEVVEVPSKKFFRVYFGFYMVI